MNQIRRLCGRVVWIENGKVRQDRRTTEVLAAYDVGGTSQYALSVFVVID